MNRTARIVCATAVTTATLGATLALPMTPAVAKAGDVVRSGNCSARTDWKLKASPENGRIEVEAEVDSNVNGQNWNWRLKHNGVVTAKGSKTTIAPSGSFTVRRVLVNLKGDDVIALRAVNPKSDEVCLGRLTF